MQIVITDCYSHRPLAIRVISTRTESNESIELGFNNAGIIRISRILKYIMTTTVVALARKRKLFCSRSFDYTIALFSLYSWTPFIAIATTSTF